MWLTIELLKNRERSPALRISEVVIPAFAAVDVEAHVMEWALNVFVSLPAFERRVFNHLAVVDEVAALWGPDSSDEKFGNIIP